VRTDDLSPVATAELPAIPRATPRTDPRPAIGQIVWTTAIDETTNAPTEPVSSYPANTSRIIATALAESLPAGSRIEATWEYNDTSLDAFSTQLTSTEMIDQTWVTFQIERDPNVPWPVGVYEVSISVDGTAVQQAAIEVTE